jgi:uncharacterized protein YuzE
MKLHDYPETDSLYIEPQAAPGVETRQIEDGLNVDFDAAGHAVGIDGASRRLDLTKLETVALPVKGARVA